MPDIPADTSTTAVIEVGSTFQDVIEIANDRDWIAFEAELGLSYQISLDGFGASPLGDPYLVIYDGNGNQIGYDDDGGPGYNSLLTFTPFVTGTFYIEARAYSSGTGGYQITVTEVQPPDFLDSIHWGSQVDHNNITVYFAASGEVFDGVSSRGWNAYERQQAMLAFQQIANVANVTFTIVDNAADADFHLVTNRSNNYLGYFNPPGTNNEGVGVFSQTGTGWDRTAGGGLEQGGYGFITLIHEFGHGMGLAHPHDGGGTSTVWEGVTGPFGSYGTFDLNQGIYTVMSYNDGWQTHPSGEVSGTLYGYQGTMMAFDIAALQQLYGANTTFNGGATTYVLPTANEPGTYFSCIWDTGGKDRIVHNGTEGAAIDLRPAHLGYAPDSGGYISYVAGIYGGFTIANGVVIENARGGSGDDLIHGNNAKNTLEGRGGADVMHGFAGADKILGGDGSDTMSGGAGSDVLNGGAGPDDIVYYGLDESRAGANQRDKIVGFKSTVDDVDLTYIDGLTWIGKSGFSDTAGEVRWRKIDSGVLLEIDGDGDGSADFAVLMRGISKIVAGDVLLA